MLAVEAWLAAPFFVALRRLGDRRCGCRCSPSTSPSPGCCCARSSARPAFGRSSPSCRRCSSCCRRPARPHTCSRPTAARSSRSLYVLLIWLTRRRRRPWCGLIFGVGFLQREFALYGLVALLVVEAIEGTLFTRAGLKGRLVLLRTAAEVWLARPVAEVVLVGGGTGHDDGRRLSAAGQRHRAGQPHLLGSRDAAARRVAHAHRALAGALRHARPAAARFRDRQRHLAGADRELDPPGGVALWRSPASLAARERHGAHGRGRCPIRSAPTWCSSRCSRARATCSAAAARWTSSSCATSCSRSSARAAWARGSCGSSPRAACAGPGSRWPARPSPCPALAQGRLLAEYIRASARRGEAADRQAPRGARRPLRLLGLLDRVSAHLPDQRADHRGVGRLRDGSARTTGSSMNTARRPCRISRTPCEGGRPIIRGLSRGGRATEDHLTAYRSRGQGFSPDRVAYAELWLRASLATFITTPRADTSRASCECLRAGRPPARTPAPRGRA